MAPADPTQLDPAQLLTVAKALAVFTAIPIVMFALWADYFGRYIDEVKEESGRRDFDVPSLLQRVRAAGAFAMMTQLLTFLAAGPVRHSYPIYATALFLASVVIQARIQFGVERKLRALEATGTDQFRLVLRVIFWFGAGGLLFAGTVVVFVHSLLTVADVFQLSKAAHAGLAILGFVLGTGTALAANFILAPLAVRRVIPTRPFENDARRTLIENCFRKAGVRVPELWLMDLDRFKASNVFVVGFGASGWTPRPALLISRSVLDSLGEHELQAVILHEASHLRLGHFYRKLLMIVGLISGMMAASALVSVLAHLAFGEEARSLVVAGFGVAAFFFTFHRLRVQSARHEVAADLEAVAALEADLSSFETALRKLDKLNEAPTAATKDGTHPNTALRIKMLNDGIRERGTTATLPPGEQNESTSRAA